MVQSYTKMEHQSGKCCLLLYYTIVVNIITDGVRYVLKKVMTENPTHYYKKFYVDIVFLEYFVGVGARATYLAREPCYGALLSP